MEEESVREFYNRQYGEQQNNCINALHDSAKADRRVTGVLRAFDITLAPGAAALDVGSGLGFYTQALAREGADVKGLDFSEVAIDAARTTFPNCCFAHGKWPQDIAEGPQYDLIWMVNFSVMNTFDVGFIRKNLIEEAMGRLRKGGVLVVGWNSNLSGQKVGGYSHWSWGTLRELQRECGLSAPRVVEVGMASSLVIQAARLARRSIPLFMVKRASG